MEGKRQQHCFGSDDEDEDCYWMKTDRLTDDQPIDIADIAALWIDDSRPKVTKEQVIVNRYRLKRKLGSGSFGVVHLVQDERERYGPTWKVLKEISVGDLSPDETLDAVKEARLQAKLHHPGIVRFHDCFLHLHSVCIITEYCEGGDLYDTIATCRKRGGQIEDDTILEWLVQLVLATDYLHERKIIHRDLKTRNIFLKENQLKIGDFGISKILTGTTDIATTFTGTPYYMSPEVLNHEGYSLKSDIWSLGIILYELCMLKRPFEGQSLMSLMLKIANGDIPALPVSRCPEIAAVYCSMLSRDVNRRPSTTEILQMPLIKTVSQDRRKPDGNNYNAVEYHLKKFNASSHTVDKRPMTPREKLAQKKERRATEEAQRIKQLTRKSYEENRRKFSQTKDKQSKASVFPWQDDKQEAKQQIAQFNGHRDSGSKEHSDHTATEMYYAQFEFDEDSSSGNEPSGSSSCEEEDALRSCMLRALNVATITQEADETVAAAPTLHKQKIQNLRQECCRLLGNAFQPVYEYLKAARFESEESINEQKIMAHLKKMVDKPRDCFLVDQLLFLEKQDEITMQNEP